MSYQSTSGWYPWSKYTDPPNEPGKEGPLTSLFNLIKETGLKIENAMSDPRVVKFMRESKIEAAEVVAEDKRRREEKSSMLKWGAGAAVVAFLIFRKK